MGYDRAPEFANVAVLIPRLRTTRKQRLTK